MVQVLLVLVIVLGLCTGARAETIAPLVEGLDSGVLLMVVTQGAEKIGATTAIIPTEVTTRDRHTIVYIVYSYDRKVWLRSAVKAVKQNHRDVIRIKIDRLKTGKLIYYQSVASGEGGYSSGNVHVFLTR